MKQPLSYVGLGSILATRARLAAIALMLIISPVVTPADPPDYGQETISTASTTMSEKTSTPTSGFILAIPNRSIFTGDLLDVRNSLFYLCFALDVCLTQYYQDVLAGGTE